MKVDIHASWKKVLQEEFDKPYFNQLVMLLKTEKQLQKTIYPPGPLIFNAFQTTPFENVSVVILGQDPYHGEGQAHGLSFSVPTGVKPPPSLMNVFKEIKQDIGVDMNVKNGNLTSWANQGVLLLNAVLTVRAGEPNSHSQSGWSNFTDAVIKKLSDEKEGIVFLLWGKFAQQKQFLINENAHYILKAAHPSPLSAHNGFLGCKHFSKTNQLLVKMGKNPVNWKL